jgi:rhodanese-related sulfurtransferase
MTASLRRGIDEVLDEARTRLDRLDAREAYDAVRAGAVLVDIRPQINRDMEGGLPGAVVIDRNVLDWRLDPASDARLPIAGYDLHVIVVCNEGYASSLAAAALQNLGIQRATDLVGGYRAWRAAGLPPLNPPNLSTRTALAR